MSTTYQDYADHHITPRKQPLCEACNSHGLVGGLLPGDGGYDGETCDECGGTGSRYPADLVESDGGEA